MVPTLGATLGVKGHRPTVGHPGLQGPAVRLRRGQRRHGRLALQHAGEPGPGQADDRQEQDPADAGGVRRPPAARRPAVPGRSAQAGGADHRQRPVAPGQADRRGAGGQPAPGVQAAAELQPAAQRHRAVLEAAASPCDAQPAVREPGGPEAVDPGQPVLLPDGPGQGPGLGRQELHPPGKPESITN